MSEAESFTPFKEVFLYDKDTGEFKESYQAQLCPVSNDGTYLCPVYNTEKRPPSVAEDEVAVFRADDIPSEGDWLVMQDHRGQTVYHQNDNSAKVITEIGNLPQDHELTPALKFQVAQAAAEMSAKVTQWRDTARYADVETIVKGTVCKWQVDVTSIGLLKDAISNCPDTWRTSDNENVAVTADDLNRIITAAVMQTQAAYKHSFELKDALLKAVKKNDLATIQKITW